MTEFGFGFQNLEDLKVVLVDKDNNTVKVQPSAKPGATDRLTVVKAALAAGLKSGLLETSPFILPSKQIKLPQYYPAISLDGELERQREEAANRIAVPLGINRNKFLAALPGRFPDRGAKYDEYALHIPLIAVDTTPFGKDWFEMTEAVLYYDPDNPEVTLKPYIYSGLRDVKVWKDPRREVKPFPQASHSVWVQDGTRYKEVNGLTPRDIRKKLENIERASDHWKGTSLTVLRPDLVKPMPWDLIGGELGSDDLPDVHWFDDQPGFHYYWDGYANPHFRALVSGSEFVVA